MWKISADVRGGGGSAPLGPPSARVRTPDDVRRGARAGAAMLAAAVPSLGQGVGREEPPDGGVHVLAARPLVQQGA